MALHSLIYIDLPSNRAHDRFVQVTALEQLDTLNEGDKVLFDALGVLTYFGKSEDEFEFGEFIQGNEYIYSCRGKRDEAAIRGSSFLDFTTFTTQVYSPRQGSEYDRRRNLIMEARTNG